MSSKTGNNIILSKINNSIDGKIGFSTLSVGWLGGIKINRFNFTDIKSQTRIAVRKITAHPRYLSILMGNLLLGETIVDEPRVEVSVKKTAEKKVSTEPDLPTEKSKSKGIAIKKINVVINNGNLKVTGKDGKTVELSQINSKFNIMGPGKQTSFDIDMYVNDKDKKSRITVEGMVRAGQMKGKWDWQKTDGNIKAKIEELDLETIGILLAAAGKEFDASGKLNTDVDVKIKNGRFEKLNVKAVLSEFERKLADKKVVLEEPVKLDAAISSDKKDVKIDRLTIESSFCKVKCSGGINSVEYNAEAELGELQDFLSQFMDFSAYSMAGDFTAKGKLTFDTSGIKTIGQADLEKVSIKSGSTKEEALISGQVPFDIEIDMNEFFFYIKSLELKSVDVVYKDKNAVEVSKVQVEGSLLKIVNGKFKKQSNKGITQVEGQLEYEYDWGAVSDIVSAFLPKDLQLEGKRKDSIKFSSKYPDGQSNKFMANLASQGKAGFDKAEYMGLEFGKTEMDIQIENGLLKMSPFSTVVNEGKFNFAGQANFNRKPAIFMTPGPLKIIENIQINDKTTKKLLAYVNPVFANAVNVTGTANFDCEKLSIPLAPDSIKSLEVVGVISVEQMRLETSDLLAQILTAVGSNSKGENITIRPTKFTLQNGFLRYENMQMDIGKQSINFKGNIGLADKSLNMKVAIPYKGGKKVSVPLRGTIDRPELDLAELLKGQIEKQLKEKLGDKLKEKLGEKLNDELTEKALKTLEGLFK